MCKEVPRDLSVRDLRPLSEIFSLDEDGQQSFLRSTFGFVTDDFRAYFGQAPIRKKNLSPKDINENLKLVPDENLYPEAPSHIKIASVPIDRNVFVKGPRLGSYSTVGGTDVLAKLLLHEVKILELLARHQHPNIIHYHGCLVRRGRIVGIVLDRHHHTLEHRFLDDARDFNAEVCATKIRSAVGHIHSLGLAHNDLKPMNVMVTSDDEPIIIDYGSCQSLGGDLISAGTTGWVDEDFTTSALRNDEVALDKIWTWLKEKTSKLPNQDGPHLD